MSPQLDTLWQQIQSLDEADRLVLGQRLQELSEAQWREEADAARQLAQQRGVNQDSIDHAMDELRYGE